ncbi:MAG: nitrate reductase subunit beta [bacterium]|nr:nitrate reductase subunit beta [bacterium]
MDVRMHVSMVFNLDKCIGCHTCSISCKNIWTDREGTEYMWWNNVETRPGTGYPIKWEDQEKFRGGWEKVNGKLRLKLYKWAGPLERIGALLALFYNPFLPTIDAYYHPWTYAYKHLFDAPYDENNPIQPTAQPISLITGEPVEIKGGPNWDDDLGGSPLYAYNDPNLSKLSEQEREMLFEIERVVFFYLPRICNHCMNAPCVSACPSGAMYKRAEDGIVLVNQNHCRGWRMCVAGCPYKKVYYNWHTGKAEKCILCYPRLESGQAPACFHSCVGRIRYFGVLLYDFEKVEEAAKADLNEIVQKQLDLILDPFDPKVINQAKKNGLTDEIIEYAQKSPVYKFVKKWKLALPLHPEYRTLPMLFYVPPLLPIKANKTGDTYGIDKDLFTTIEKYRLPIEYFANMFTAGNKELMKEVFKKMIALRIYRRAITVGDVDKGVLNEAGFNEEDANEYFYLTSIAKFEDRFVIPTFIREIKVEQLMEPLAYKAKMGFNIRQEAKRGG